MGTMLVRGGEHLALSRVNRYLLMLAHLRAPQAFECRWPPSKGERDVGRDVGGGRSGGADVGACVRRLAVDPPTLGTLVPATVTLGRG